jgi:signal transduction histidine kinase
MGMKRLTAAVAVLLAGTTLALAEQKPTKDDAVAMVKQAAAEIKAVGPEKAYKEIDGGKFRNGSLYIVVSGFNGVTLAHPVNPKLIGRNMSEEQDVDGKYFARDMSELARKGQPFWYAFKFVNPETKKIEIKDNYCETVNDTRVCAGVYRS